MAGEWIRLDTDLRREHVGKRVRRVFDGVTTEGVCRAAGAGAVWLGDSPRGSVHVSSAGIWSVKCDGCCPSCDGLGAGGPASGPETNGRCADCRATGHGQHPDE